MKRKWGRLLRQAAFSLALGLVAAPAFSQSELPPQLQAGAPSDVPITIQLLRWRMNDAEINALAFRSMDTLFTTRAVPRAGPAWPLERADRPLDFTYQYEGRAYTPEQFLDRTYTDAMLVMKDGRIVHEHYGNHSDQQTRFIGWSATKSLISLLVGIALDQGLIGSIDDPIESYLPELEGGAYQGVTVRQILQMRSGVDYEERYDFSNPGRRRTTLTRW